MKDESEKINELRKKNMEDYEKMHKEKMEQDKKIFEMKKALAKAEHQNHILSINNNYLNRRIQMNNQELQQLNDNYNNNEGYQIYNNQNYPIYNDTYSQMNPYTYNINYQQYY